MNTDLAPYFEIGFKSYEPGGKKSGLMARIPLSYGHISSHLDTISLKLSTHIYFTPCGQKIKIRKIVFCGFITSVLYRNATTLYGLSTSFNTFIYATGTNMLLPKVQKWAWRVVYGVDHIFLTTRDACSRKGQGGEICEKGAKFTILTAYPGTDLRDDNWERRTFEILEFTKGTNSGLTISGRGWPTANLAII